MAELVESSRRRATSRCCGSNRPEARNALSPELMEELAGELERLDADPEVRCIVIAGSEEVFAAGADIRAMSERSFAEALHHPAAGFWQRLAAIKTPMIAAVSGWALGGGCELALACDMIVASETRRLRPARDHPRDHPRRRRHPAAGPGDRQAAGDGAGAHRAPLRRRRGAASWASSTRSSAEGSWLEEALELARDGRRAAADRRPARQAGGARRRGDDALGRARERAPPLRAGDGDRGPGRGHAGLPREARAEVRGPLMANLFEPDFDESSDQPGFSWQRAKLGRPGRRRAARRQPLRAAAGRGRSSPSTTTSATRSC